MDLFKYFRSKPETIALPASPAGIPPITPQMIEAARAEYQNLRSGKTVFAGLPPEFRMLNDSMMRSYDAAVNNQFNKDMRPVYGSANAELLTSLYTARAKARSITYNDPHGKAIIRTGADNVVGHRPFRLKMRIGSKTGGKFVADEDLNSQIEEEWKIYGMPENYTVSGEMSRDEAWCIAEMSALRDGGILFKRYRNFKFNKYRYAVDILESDHLDQNYMGKAPISGNSIRFSIEYDSYYERRPVAAWLLTRHPGDPFGAPSRLSNNWRERVEISDILIYRNLRDRAEQDIGMIEMDSIIQHLHRTRQYDVALALAAIASCCKQYWIKKNFPTGMMFTTEEAAGFMNQFVNQITGPTGTNGQGQNTGTVGRQQGIGVPSVNDVPASIMQIPYGEEFMQNDPKFPIEASVHFKKDNLMEAATGVGQAYDSISGDYQNLGFSAARLSQQAPRQNYRRRQSHFKMQICRAEFREWMRSSIMSGVFDIPISRLEECVNAAHFQGVRWESANPLQDVQATILLYEAGFVSEQQIQDELEDGQDLTSLYAQREEAKRLQEKHGLNFEGEDVTKATISKGEPGQTVPKPGEEAQPTPKRRPANPVRSRGVSETTARILALQGDGRNGYHD